MKKIFAVFLAALIISAICLPSFAAPATNSSIVQGATTTLSASEVVNGKEFEMSMELYVDPSYDYFYAANFTFIYDNSLIDITSVSEFSADSGYQVAPMRKSENQINVVVGNAYKTAPASSGYACTVTFKMKVVDADKLIAAGAAQVDIGLFKDDFAVYKDGVVNDYWEVINSSPSYNMAITFNPMTLSIENSTPGTSYTITYNTNGGNNIAPQSVTAGSSATLPVPTKSNYTFEGWYSDSDLTKKVSSSYKPTANVTLYANWTAAWDGTSSCLIKGATTTLSASDVVDGKEFTMSMDLYVDPSYDYFYAANFTLIYNNNLIDITSLSDFSVKTPYAVAPVQKFANQINVVVGNPSKVAPAADGYVCTVTCKMKVVDADKLIENGTAQVDIGLYKDDFTIYKDGEVQDYYEVVNSTPSYDMTITFIPMTLNIKGASYTITYNTNGGNSIDSETVDEGESVTLPVPTRDNYDFEGWYTDSSLTNKVTSPYTPTSDITLYAKWTEVSNNWIISFESNGGSSVSNISVVRGESATLPTPTRSNYTFVGWYSDSSLTTKVTSPYTPTSDITLYAKWTPVSTAEYWTITFDSNGGKSVSNISVVRGDSATLPTPTRSGYTFVGWYSESRLTTRVRSPYTPTSDITLYAKWTANSSSGSGTGTSTGDRTVTVTDTGTGTGTGSGTGTGTGTGTSGTSTTGATEIGTSYTVTYNTNGGNSIPASTVQAGSSVTLPTPAKSGYTFAGWYTDSDLKNKVSDSTYTPTGNVTLYAKWTATVSSDTIPKTGTQSRILLFGAIIFLCLSAGSVVLNRYRKIRSGR